MPKRKQESAETPIHACASPGCAEPAEHRAPRSRDNLREYQWFCLTHIREFNQKWDYFKGMDSDEIEAFRQDSLTGHRPTWERETIGVTRGPSKLKEGLARFFNWDEASIRANARTHLPPRERKALGTLELDDHVTPKQLKTQFRALVKRHHPDLHPGDKDVEEKFKQINAAYKYLLKLYEA